MARLIPTHDIERIDNEGERIVIRALVNNLPADVDVLWSLKINISNNPRNLNVREGDVIVLDPRVGVLVIEVKGGENYFDKNRNVWVQKIISAGGATEERTRDPTEQSQTLMHALMRQTKTKLGVRPNEMLPFTFAYAVAFPHARFQGEPPTGIAPSQILDAISLDNITTRVGDAFAVQRKPDHRPMTECHVEAVRRVLLPEWKAMIYLPTIIKDVEKGITSATTDQQRFLLSMLSQINEAKISGPAGTGKTVIARSKALELAAEGKRVAFLCYNRSLADWIASDHPPVRNPNLTIATFHQIAAHLCGRAGISFQPDADAHSRSTFYDEKAPELMLDAITKLRGEGKSSDLFDAVIVDEGQDFAPLWWSAVDELFRLKTHDRIFYIFYDPHQNIRFGKAGLGDMPKELMGPYTLSENCRNTQMIGAHCAKLVQIQNNFRHGQPIGVEPTFTQTKTWVAAAQEVSRAAAHLCDRNGGGLSPRQIAILAPAQKLDLLPGLPNGIATCKEVQRWRDGRGILKTTPAKFKGLEADAIISVEEGGGDGIDESGDVTAYVARTRAKAILTVITYPVSR